MSVRKSRTGLLSKRHTFSNDRGGVVEYIQSCSPRSDQKERDKFADLEAQISKSESEKPFEEVESSIAKEITGSENHLQPMKVFACRVVHGASLLSFGLVSWQFRSSELKCSFLNEQQSVYYHANTCGNEKD